MITEAILNVIRVVITAPLSLLPSLPAMPSAVVDSGSWIINQISIVYGFVVEVVSLPLFVALILIVFGWFVFEPIYKTVLWILAKLPVPIK